MAAGTPVYKLRTVLQGHSMDVKHVSLVQEPSGALLTASRDKTGRMWYEDDGPSLIIAIILQQVSARGQQLQREEDLQGPH